jgi:hypothetical protein
MRCDTQAYLMVRGRLRVARRPHLSETEQQVEKRLAEDLKCALATKSSRHGNEPKRDKVAGE